jgi:hypothetical protein
MGFSILLAVIPGVFEVNVSHTPSKKEVHLDRKDFKSHIDVFGSPVPAILNVHG